MKVDFYKHNLQMEDVNAVVSALKEPILTTGKIVHTFENKLAKYTRNRFAIGTMSCSHSLELALRVLNIGPGDEVITTPMTFIATTNSIIKLGAKPIFVDIENDTGNINVDLIEEAITKKTKAILVVHLYGVMCDMQAVKKIADRYKLKVVEDSAHCIEGSRDGTKPGNIGDFACFSFYATKNITCGEGGAISFNNEEYVDKIRVLYLHGMDKSAEKRFTEGYQHWNMEFLGIKANMSNIQAALLVNQIDRIDQQLKVREEICRKYEIAFENAPGVNILKVPPSVITSRHLFIIKVNPMFRNQIIKEIQDHNVGVTINYRAVHTMSYYKEKFEYKPEMFKIANQFGESVISLPLYVSLKPDEQDYVIEVVKKIAKKYE